MADDDIERVLAAWTPLAPPADFADRVTDRLAAPPRRRWPTAVAACALAAAVLAVVVWPRTRAARGTLRATHITTAELGDRGVAVAEPASDLAWNIAADGSADIEQRAGNVFYRIEHGGAFAVHTSAGTIRVTGTCFRIEVDPMNTRQKMLVSGAVGAALATAIVVTVYEGHVLAETTTGTTALAAGSRVAITRDGHATIVTETATREDLIARTQAQQQEIVRLRAQLAGQQHTDDPMEAFTGTEPGRPWYDPSPERMQQYATMCHVRVDEPGLSGKYGDDASTRDIAPAEAADYKAALDEVAKPWRALVRSLYIEATGDTAGADTLSTDAMRHEIEEKSAPNDYAHAMFRISHERAHLQAPPADVAKTPPIERLLRAWAQLGDQSEAAVAKRLGAVRAKAIRGDGWGARADDGGCPTE